MGQQHWGLDTDPFVPLTLTDQPHILLGTEDFSFSNNLEKKNNNNNNNNQQNPPKPPPHQKK